MPKVVEPDSALDWYTVGQLCESAGADLVIANPNDPKLGRIDLYRRILVNGKPYCVRVKLTIVGAV